MSSRASQADLHTTSMTETKSDHAGCEICPSAGSNYCICQMIFANIITAHGEDFDEKIDFHTMVSS